MFGDGWFRFQPNHESGRDQGMNTIRTQMSERGLAWIYYWIDGSEVFADAPNSISGSFWNAPPALRRIKEMRDEVLMEIGAPASGIGIRLAN